MYDELAERLRSQARLDRYYNGTGKLYDDAANAIESLSEDNAALNGTVTKLLEQIKELGKPRWIPVTERLPKKEGETYWICTDSGYQCECRWTNNMHGLGESDRWGWHIMDKPQYQKVIAWRELPDPYKTPKEEAT